MNTISDNAMHNDEEHEIYKDAERFSWWFSTTRDKPAFHDNLTTLLDHGFREGWSMDQWRGVIDWAMQAEDEAEDAELNRKLTESLSKNRKA